MVSAYAGSPESDRMDIPPMNDVINLSGLLAEIRHAHHPSTKRSMTSPSSQLPAATLSPGSKPSDSTLIISFVESTTMAEVLAARVSSRWQRSRLAYAHPRISWHEQRTDKQELNAVRTSGTLSSYQRQALIRMHQLRRATPGAHFPPGHHVGQFGSLKVKPHSVPDPLVLKLAQTGQQHIGHG